ncbi:hypothetical protein [Actinorugispora endophytica]|uniref:Uncharacterized protein n=1 Tax=Actinorugispora endophytica TaxID=1605990 RepID=A0A4R6V4R6_9ACTN|nr:hypothetical protein [Actinorugispora endophytica]TDQ55415.1 hypothetical protein EV190_101742 [Actinorugispora endophytica]
MSAYERPRAGREHRLSPGVPRWANIAAHATALVSLPSGLWRIALVAGVPLVAFDTSRIGVWESVYIVSLSVVLEGLAFLTLGLVRPWGETVPRWVPLLAGRRIPPLAVTVPALSGAAALTCLWGYGCYAMAVLPPIGTPVQHAVLVACYAPLLLWGPLLVAVTAHYHRRRRAEPSRV